MGDPIDSTVPGFRAELDGGAVVSTEPAATGPACVLVRLPADRAHVLAHVLADWAGAFAVVLDGGEPPSDYLLGRTIDDAALAAGDPEALACAARKHGTVPAVQRRAAVAVLEEREPRLSGLQRLAVVDAAAGWLQQEAGDELAFALLGAVCSTDITTSQAYVALLAPPPAEDTAPESAP